MYTVHLRRCIMYCTLHYFLCHVRPFLTGSASLLLPWLPPTQTQTHKHTLYVHSAFQRSSQPQMDVNTLLTCGYELSVEASFLVGHGAPLTALQIVSTAAKRAEERLKLLLSSLSHNQVNTLTLQIPFLFTSLSFKWSVYNRAKQGLLPLSWRRLKGGGVRAVEKGQSSAETFSRATSQF